MECLHVMIPGTKQLNHIKESRKQRILPSIEVALVFFCRKRCLNDGAA